MASTRLLVRDVPSEVQQWISSECARTKISQQQLLLSILKGVAEGASQYSLFSSPAVRVQVSSDSLPFTFIDLFAGIGGMRLGLEAIGGKCVFTSEWDRNCQRTYADWFGETPEGDIVEIVRNHLDAIPRHDILAAGFPCQPFSIAGVSKKNALGRPHGFDDAEQGNLFFSLAAVIEARRPRAFILENVKNLRSHDKGRTWDVIRSTLESMRYAVFATVLDAAAWVPQHRERIFVVGFDRDYFGDSPPFSFPAEPEGEAPKFESILEKEVDRKYTLTDHLWRYLKAYAAKHKAKGNGFGYGLADSDKPTRTLSARYYKDGSEILVPQKGANPRRLTPRECARLMGFPDSCRIVVSDTQAYKQFGNAVVPAVVSAVGKRVLEVFRAHIYERKAGLLVPDSIGRVSDSRLGAEGHVVAGM